MRQNVEEEACSWNAPWLHPLPGQLAGPHAPIPLPLLLPPERSGASAAEVRRAYKKLALLYHPDKAKGQGPEQQAAIADRFKQVHHVGAGGARPPPACPLSRTVMHRPASNQSQSPR